jgi:ABC-type multidrug transport system ATPase subunit
LISTQIRTPWTLILFVFFPAIMLSILFGLQTTLVGRFGLNSSPPLPTKCTDAEAYFPTTGNCITLGFTDDSDNATQLEAHWRTLQVLARHLGWTMSNTVGDVSHAYDVVFFGYNSTSLEKFRYESTTYLKYAVTYHQPNVLFSWSGGRTPEWNTENLYAQVGGPADFDVNYFGFADTMENPEARAVASLQLLMMDAYIGYRQSVTLDIPWDHVPFPDIKTSHFKVSDAGGGSGRGGFNTGVFWVIGGPIIIWISLFASQLYMSSQILEDRRKKLRLGMVMMGLNTGAYQVSWFLFHVVLSAIYSAIALGIGYACKFQFFTNTNPAVIFLLYWCTSWGAIGFTMLTTSLVHHPTGHTALMVVMFLIGLVLAVFASMLLGEIYTVFWSQSGMRQVWSVNYAFQFGNVMRKIAQISLADIQDGPNATRPYFSWADVHVRDELTARLYIPSVSESFGWMILCGVLGLLCSIYLEIVFPREIGSPQGFGFFFLPSYWGFDTKSRLNVETVAHRSNKMSDVAVDLDPDVQAEYNDVMSRLSSADPSLALAITKISKTFQKKRTASDQDTRAVDSVTLGADAGCVLGIVGHNGAGKTTLMSMLCGVVSVSTGDARVFGHSISQNMTSIHSVMGVCPQEDVLWPELTPWEHLKLFSILKRIPWSDHKRVISDSLVEVGLFDVRDRIANKLSGGMKRRLSVAIALIGNVKILMLDEPTAGLDPRNRLEIWTIIERIKQNRVVVLTTHSMVEASTLADKIAVMAVGRLRAVGSPQHLVQRYGKGHQINIISKISKNEEVKAVMTELMPDAQLEVDTGARLTYSLAASKSRQLPGFCKYMETDNSSSGLIEDWGISQTTLEQVFLRLTHGGGNQDGLNNAASLQLNIALEGSNDVLGFVAILPATTLDEAREMMLTNELFPKEFTFVCNKAPVARAQERSTSAYRSLPTIELRLAVGAELDLPPRAVRANGDYSMDIDVIDDGQISVPALKARINQLEQQLQDREQLIVTVNKLQKKVSKLKAKLKAFEAQSHINQ